MRAKRKNRFKQSMPVWLTILGMVGLGLLIKIMLRGKDVALLNPKGYIADSQYHLILFTTALMLSIAIPTMFILYFFAWKYRESNQNAIFEPNKRHGKFFVFSVWAVPSAFALALTLVMWPAAHRLDQHKLIASDQKPLTIQVVALRWKWLFIYPEQNISTVNYIQVPTGTPLQFELTADETPMSSFWIPHLGGQLYAMTGHVNRLNLIAASPGDYSGRSAEINGAGFQGMKFITRASSKADFDLWVETVRQSSTALNSDVYDNLLTPSEDNPAEYYSAAESGLYGKVLNKYMGSHTHTRQE